MSNTHDTSRDLDSLLSSEAYFEDPYPIYDRLRTEAPVFWSEKWAAWVVTRHEDIAGIAKDTKSFSNAGRITLFLNQLPPSEQAQLSYLKAHYEDAGLVHSDPPDHARLRRLVSKAFTPRMIENMRGEVVRIVDSLLDRVQLRGEMDLIRDFAFPLPAIIIAGMLGVPDEEREQFKDWSDKIQQFLGTGRANLERALEAQESWRAMNAYFEKLVAERRREPQDDIVSGLISARDEKDALTEKEMIGTCGAMLIAGHETTTNLISNSILILMGNPQTRRELSEKPELYPTATEEFLRFESPFQSAPRTCRADTKIGGQLIREGNLVHLMLGAANRDPEKFENPSQLNIHRQDLKHVAFGHGIHLCLGAALARLEGPIAIEAALRRLPELRLAKGKRPLWKRSMVQRGMITMPVVWDGQESRL